MWERLFQVFIKESQEKAEANFVAFDLAKTLLNFDQAKIGVSIEHLNKDMRPLVDKLLKLCPDIKIISCLRTFKEQERLFAQGRTTEGSIVTKAHAGESYHNYGLAFDFMFIDDPKWQAPKERWEKVGKTGEAIGLIWGGRFGDVGHFEYHNGFTWEKLKKYFI